MTLRDYIKDVKKDWSDKEWLQHCSIQMHNPWISEEDRLYYNCLLYTSPSPRDRG